jgi:ubiquinone/menaquinone biosynthesis C-methylase UbiE
VKDRQYLLGSQYRDASNVNARLQLHARFSAKTYGWQHWVFDLLDIPPSGTVLELGCGPGSLWVENKDRIPRGWEITLSDLSPGMLEEARRNLESTDCSFDFRVIDAQEIPLEDHSLDAVIANHMLYHIPDRAKALSEIRRVLKPTGSLYAATNGCDHMHELTELGRRVGAEFPPMYTIDFTLENGTEELHAWFEGVSLHCYSDHLQITDVEPLLDYLRSDTCGFPLTDEQLRDLSRAVEQKIAQHEAFHITKSPGVFIASAKAY